MQLWSYVEVAIFDLFGKLGKTFDNVTRGVSGSNVIINGRKVIVDGKVITDEAEGVIELRITDGALQNVETTCDVTITGDVRGNVNAGMNVTCGHVGGDVDAGMEARVRGNVQGSVEAGMSVSANDIMGDAEAGMNISAKEIKGKSRSAF